MHVPSTENLKREIGIFGLAIAVINITIGSGIFVLPAVVAEKTGAAAIICYLVCGLLIFLIGLCFAEVGSKISVSGGTYAYIESAFGPFAGFLANNIFVFGSCVLSDAAIANAMYDLLSNLFPFLHSLPVKIIFLLLLFGGLGWINIYGTKYGLRFIMLATFIKLIPLVAIITFGVGHVTVTNLHWSSIPSLEEIGAASLLLFYAFLGIETAVTNSGEFKNPGRTVPLGIITGLSFVLLLYIAIQLTTQGVLGKQLLENKEAPLAAVSNIIFGKAGFLLITIGTLISMLGAVSGEIFAIPRVLFAGARDGLLPKFLSAVHPSFQTPYNAIIVYSILDFILALSGGFKQLAILSSAATLIIYLGVVLAAVKIKAGKNAVLQKTFSIPGGVIIPVITAFFIVWMLSHLSAEELKGFSVFLLVLTAVYAVVRIFRR